MNIRQTNLATSLSLAFLFVGLVAYEFTVLLREKGQQQATAGIVETGSVLNQGTIELSLERSVMQVTLNLPDPIAPPFRALIEQQRSVFADSLAQTRTLLASIDIDPETVTSALGALSAAEQEIADIRRRADALLARPRDERNPEDIEALPNALKGAIVELSAVPSLLRSDGMRVSSRLQTLLDIQAQAWAVREFGGQERTYLAIATASGEPMSAARRSEMKQLHNRAATSMLRLKALGQFDGLSETVKSQIADLETGYFQDYRALREALLNHDTSEGPYPVSFEDFFSRSTSALDLAVDLSIQAGDQTKAFLDEYNRSFWTRLIAFSGLLVLVVMVCGWQLYFSQVQVSGRLSRLAEQMRRLASGDTQIDSGDQNRRDEIGDMARAFHVFKTNALERVALERRAVEERDRERQRQTHMEHVIRNFSGSLETATGQVSEQAHALLDTSKRLNTAAETATGHAVNADQATGSAASGVETAAAAAEQLAISITGIADQTQKAQDRMRSAALRSQASNEQVRLLTSSVDRIGAVVKLISDIAQQTNLLALNATIEAARAGEAGRGFAVVANEVKALASQTARATDEISSQIADIQTSTHTTVASIEEVSHAVEDIQQLTIGIAEAIEQQKNATREIAESVSSASAGAATVLTSVQSVTGAITTTNEEANTVRNAASVLTTATRNMADEVDTFLKKVSEDVTQRRNALRIALSEVAIVNAGGARQNAQFVNISKTGARLKNVSSLAAGQALVLELSNYQKVTCKVVRQTEDDVAVQFDVPLSDSDFDQLTVQAA
ncbi:methyl-accepting chemotaxis protein [Roseibium aquae]|uniref:Methyl-accepting chemotaxis protein n=1 Tax=Roseibium aquae TaxID=1323746 RepID=A0A916TKA7_9HYPH|nr:methyl-accepting chemotaxis protein [Roseibium aquae]GGB48478.1 methyl-accepting chemotaxis protein [Roseibium aquae]